MARKVIWTLTAKNQRREILEFWIKKTGSRRYSRKLSKLLRRKVELLINFKNLGRATVFEDVRVTTSGHYSIYYTIHNDSIIIICLWDGRRDPKDLMKILK